MPKKAVIEEYAKLAIFLYAPESLYIYSVLLRQDEVASFYTKAFAYLVTYVLMGQIQWLEKYWILKSKPISRVLKQSNTTQY